MDSMFKRATKSRLRVFMERVSSRLTRQVAIHFGPRLPQFYVCEYPRSGGTWLSRMLADYYGVARPGLSVFPIGCPAVVHAHWKFHPKMRNVYVLVRDGRDVMTSYWFYSMRNIKTKKSYQHVKNHQELQKHLGADYDPENPGAHMADFIRYAFSTPRGTPLNWADYYRSWHNPEKYPYLAYLTYEELLETPVESLARAIEHIMGEPPDVPRIERSVEHFSMASYTGRKPGEESRLSFIRKGISGDWKNYFTPESAKVFDELAGDLLVGFGYEQDRDWVARFTQEYEARQNKPEPAAT